MLMPRNTAHNCGVEIAIARYRHYISQCRQSDCGQCAGRPARSFAQGALAGDRQALAVSTMPMFLGRKDVAGMPAGYPLPSDRQASLPLRIT